MVKKAMTLALVGILVLTTIMLAGCPAPQAEVGVPQEVVAGLGRDPGVMYGYGAHPPLTRVLEPLVFRDVKLEHKPGLATSWEVSDDGLTWTIKLREGVRFHDGTPFDAEAVKHNLERVSERWPGRFGLIKSIEAAGEYTVKIIHEEPFVPFLYALAWPGAAMISPAAIDDEGKVSEPIGTGPFKRVEWVPGEKLVMERNEGYWGTRPRLERVTLKVIPDPTTRIMALEAEEIDMIIDTGGVLPEHVPVLLMHPEIEVLTVAGAVPHYMTLNTRSVFFNDTRVRRAIVYAIDPDSIIRYALEGYGKVMTTVTPHSEKAWMYPEPLFHFNSPDRAQELLQEAGWIDTDGDGIREKDGKDFEVTFLLATGLVGRWPYDTIAEIVQAQLREVGIQVEILTVETGLWREKLRRGEAEISMRPWAGISPQTRLDAWLHSEGTNVLGMGIFYSNQEVDKLIEELMRTTDEKEAKRLAFEIQKIAAQDVPIIPIYDEVLVNAIRDNIRGYELHPWFTVNWEDIYVVAP
ncbi:ABC transporter substrate-binding protein [Dehalococcoidia bacterium]|nr:ABC transporter substrate-binding protein [Dehalococcoidia bacterium]